MAYNIGFSGLKVRWEIVISYYLCYSIKFSKCYSLNNLGAHKQQYIDTEDKDTQFKNQGPADIDGTKST